MPRVRDIEVRVDLRDDSYEVRVVVPRGLCGRVCEILADVAKGLDEVVRARHPSSWIARTVGVAVGTLASLCETTCGRVREVAEPGKVREACRVLELPKGYCEDMVRIAEQLRG